MIMKLRLSLAAALAVVALTGLCIFQRQQLARQKAHITSLRTSVDQKSDAIKELNAAKDQAIRQRQEILGQADAQATQLKVERAAAAAVAAKLGKSPPSGDHGSSNAGGTDMGKLFAKMMEDPQTKGFLRTQQRMVMDRLYAPLAKRLRLSPETTEKFNEVLADNAMKSAEKVSSLLGSGAAPDRKEAIAAVAADSKNLDNQVRDILGEGGYADYKEYQLTLSERMQLSLFKQQAGGSDAALTEQQTEQLLTVMKEEKQTWAAAGNPVLSGGGTGADVEAILAEDQSERLIQTQEAVNERVYERAKGLLNGEQLDAFAKFQTNQLQMMRMGMSMARKLMGGDGAAAQTAD